MTDLSYKPLSRSGAMRARATLLFGALLLWMLFVLVSYYSQLWKLLFEDWKRPAIHLLRMFPFWAEAMQRAVVGVAGASLLIVSAVLLGLFIFRFANWRFANAREKIPFAAAIGMCLFVYMGLALAAFGHYRSETLHILVVLPFLLWVPWLWRHRHFSFQQFELGFHHPARGEWVWIGCTTLAVLLTFIAALAPEHEYDALWYHLAYPQRYLQLGRLVDLPYDYVSLYPMTFELWFGYGLAIGNQMTATLLHTACLFFTSLIVYEMARRFVPSASPWLAVALFSTIPLVMWEASTAYIDLGLAFYVTLSVYALLCYIQSRQFHWLMLSGVTLGMALAIKHLALIVLGLALLGLVIRLWRTDHRPGPALRAALFLTGLSLLLPLPWYVRSWLATGNPVFPELYSFFGAPATRWDALTDQGLQRFLDQFGPARTLPNMITLPWHMTIHAAAYDGTLGPLFLLFLPLVILFMHRKGVLPWLFAFVLLYIVFWASPLSSFQMRFLVPITPLLAILAAAAFTRLGSLGRLAAGRQAISWLSIALAVLMVLNLPFFTPLHEHDRVGWEGWLNSTLHGIPFGVVLGAESRQAYLERTVSSYAVWEYAQQVLPAQARVLTWTGGDQFYSQINQVWSLSTIARPIAWAPPGSDQQVLKGLQRLGITHIIAPTPIAGQPAEQVQISVLSPKARSEWYDTLYQDQHYSLYRIRWEALQSDLTGLQP